MLKKILVALAMVVSVNAFAEASFDQIQTLIQQKNYAAAEAGLEVIIKNHPNSAKAFYAMAQAQAGLGNLDKANKALNLAKGIDPSLKFVSESSVRNLEQAITPQTAKIEYVDESHWVRNFIILLILAGGGYGVYVLYKRRNEIEEAVTQAAETAARNRDGWLERQAQRDAERAEAVRKEEEARAEAVRKEEEAQAALRAHKNYGKPGFDPSNPDKLKTKAQLKKEADEAAREAANAEARRQRLRAEAAEDEVRRARSYHSSAPTTTVVHNNSGNDMLTGVLIGNMLSGSHHSHDTTVIRETTRETSPSRDSSWDRDSSSSSSSRSSSWDDTPSKSSSWDSDSSSSRSSSWDSDSSSSSSWSSSSDSSSSWDSGSSSSDSSW